MHRSKYRSSQLLIAKILAKREFFLVQIRHILAKNGEEMATENN